MNFGHFITTLKYITQIHAKLLEIELLGKITVTKKKTQTETKFAILNYRWNYLVQFEFVICVDKKLQKK